MTGRARLRAVADALLAVFVAGVGVIEIWAPLSSVMGSGSNVVSTALVVPTCLALAVRRRWPLQVLLTVVVLFVGGLATHQLYVLFYGGFLPLGIAVFSVARHGKGCEPYYGAAIAAASLLVLDLSVPSLQAASEIVFHWFVIAVVWCFGWGLRLHERRAQESMERAIRAEVSAAEQAMAAIVEERTRIARELHDVVAHAVSMIVVQAGAAEQAVDDDPAYARTALSTIRRTGADALDEMRRVVAVLRQGDEAGARSPAPGMAALPALVQEVREAGLEVRLTTEGEQRDLPAGLDLAAYRIVQEALTNVRKHARASRVDVLIRYGAAQVELEVRDDGAPGAASGRTGGHGLVGMRERAALYGGSLEAGPCPEGGFLVRATMPVVPVGAA